MKFTTELLTPQICEVCLIDLIDAEELMNEFAGLMQYRGYVINLEKAGFSRIAEGEKDKIVILRELCTWILVTHRVIAFYGACTSDRAFLEDIGADVFDNQQQAVVSLDNLLAPYQSILLC